MRRLIFLDIDGVLVTERSIHAEHKRTGRAHSGLQSAFDSMAVKQLNRVLSATSPWIVLSSVWRLGDEGVDEIARRARIRGFRQRLIGRTPDLTRVPGKPREYAHHPRGDEVARWLKEHGAKSDRFVILDDDDDMGALTDHLIRCDWKTGLTKPLADEAIRRLEAAQ